MTEPTQIHPELTVDDIVGAASEAKYHSILEVWREVLSPAEAQIGARITPQWANRMVQSYSEVTFANCERLANTYYTRIVDLSSILQERIDSDEECLKVTNEAEDVEQNTGHYLHVLMAWQRQFMEWELAWDSSDEDAGLDIAALAEVHKMFFDPQGITALLDQINFEFTDADRELLATQLQELVDEAEVGSRE